MIMIHNICRVLHGKKLLSGTQTCRVGIEQIFKGLIGKFLRMHILHWQQELDKKVLTASRN